MTNTTLHRIPDISQQIREQAESTAIELERLGHPPSDDSIGEIDLISDMMTSAIKQGIERVSREQGNLLYLIEDEAMRLKSELRATCSEFRAWEKDLKDPPSVTPLPDILLEDGEPSTSGRTRKIIYLDEVLSRKTRYVVTVTSPCVVSPLIDSSHIAQPPVDSRMEVNMGWLRNTSNRSQSNGMVQRIGSLQKQKATSGFSSMTQLTLDVGIIYMVVSLAICGTAFPSSLGTVTLTF